MAVAEGDQVVRLDLLRRAARLSAAANELALDHLEGHPRDGFLHFGTGTPDIDAHLDAVEATTQKLHYSMKPIMLFDPWDPAPELDERSRSRGVEMSAILSQRAFDVSPLLSSIEPGLHVGDAVATLFILDRSLVILPGPTTGDGYTTAWAATRSDILGQALEIWDLAWARSRPAIAPGGSAPFTPRQVAVALLMAQGKKDATISRELGVSVRTVVSEIATLTDKLNANNRVEAVLALRRGVKRRESGNPSPSL